MKIEKMTYLDIVNAVGKNVSLSFEMLNNKLIVKMESLKHEDTEKEVYSEIKTISYKQ